MRSTNAFDPDRPIASAGEDRLGVDAFVRRLIAPLLHAPADATLVVGLYGEWGHGKSSALNLLEVALRETRSQTLQNDARAVQSVVVRFTPWLYSNVEALLRAFFETLADGIGGFGGMDADGRKRLKAALKGISDFVAPAVKVGACVVGGGAASAIVGAVADAAAGAAKGSSDAITASEISFRRLKADASEVLRNLAEQGTPQRVVVLIDDLDRAASVDELLAMLKVVKLVADLPNISYVVAIDRERVRNLLRSGVPQSFGDDFLDKIIQVPVSLPPVRSKQLSRLVVDEATKIATDAGLDVSTLSVNWETWDILRHDNYESMLRPALRTPRDAARILNLYRFAALTAGAQPQLHAVDLLLLSVLQAKYPMVYESVRRNHAFLLAEEPDWPAVLAGEDKKQKSLQARQQRLLEITGGASLPQEQAADAFKVLRYLFPHALGGHPNELDAQRARYSARIQSPDRFDGYFHLQPPEHDVPRHEVDALYDTLIVASAQPDEEWAATVASSLRSMDGPPRRSLLTQLDDRAAGMVLAEARALAKVLPALARAVIGIESTDDAIEGLATHSFRVLSTFRDVESERRQADVDDGVAMLVGLVNALSPLTAGEYADSLVKSSELESAIGAANRVVVAKAGLGRLHGWFESTPDPFAVIEARAAVEAIWAWFRLAFSAGEMTDRRPHPGLHKFLGDLLIRNPSRLSDVISLAAGWRRGGVANEGCRSFARARK